MLLSYFSSGFPSHVKGKALDLSSDDMEYFYSPFYGRIERIEKFVVGRPNRFAEVNYDYLILLRRENGKLIKILHVEPFITVGEEIKKGDKLGKFLINPYTGGDFLHAHIEGLRIKFPKLTKYDERGIGKVVNKCKNYFDVEIITYSAAGNLRGLGCCGGLLNASLPYAGYGGIIGIENVSEVKIGNMKFFIHRIKKRNIVMFEVRKGLIRNWEYSPSFKVLEGKPIYGLPLFEAVLSINSLPRVRFFIKNSKFNEGDEVDVWELINSSSYLLP
ncbi:MAG: hypothetical protein RXQ99_06480 [Acidianus sp.]|uniref:hypothetical protein n=1 Tax=Acidianus sp. TaxID=1872104 RepID=UPI00397A2457